MTALRALAALILAALAAPALAYDSPTYETIRVRQMPIFAACNGGALVPQGGAPALCASFLAPNGDGSQLTGVNAAQFAGKTWAAPGALGATTPASIKGTTITATTSVVPASTGGADLGAGSARWRYAFVNNLFLGNALLLNAAPSIASGFGTGPSIVGWNGSNVWRVNVGAGGTAASGVITLGGAAIHWNCQFTNLSTMSSAVFLTRQTASTTTTVTFGNFNSSGASAPWAAGDIIAALCLAM